MYPNAPVLVVDDEAAALRTSIRMLRAGGVENLLTLQDSRDVLATLAQQEVATVLLDLAMPFLSGEDLLPMLLEQFPNVPVIIFTGFNDVDVAVRCMHGGAFDYLVKPVEESRLLSSVKRAVELWELRGENLRLRDKVLDERLEHPEAFEKILTRSASMQAIFKYLETLSKSLRPALIMGETGVGKELIARAIHSLSEAKGDFVAVNLGGLDDTVFSDTLFGHVKGAYTGADEARKGLIEQAADGTLFLDEIGELNNACQVKLLRLIQEREYFALGADLPKRSHARIVVATNRNLELMQETGVFRRDLYYRLNAHQIRIPPLRDRLEDLPLLVEHFLRSAAESLGKAKPTTPREAYDLLGTYHFPGNIRELEAMVFDAVGRHESKVLSLESFREHIRTRALPDRAPRALPQDKLHFPERLPTLKAARAALTEEALRRANGNQSIAADILGISRTALNKWLKKKELEEE